MWACVFVGSGIHTTGNISYTSENERQKSGVWSLKTTIDCPPVFVVSKIGLFKLDRAIVYREKNRRLTDSNTHNILNRSTNIQVENNNANHFSRTRGIKRNYIFRLIMYRTLQTSIWEKFPKAPQRGQTSLFFSPSNVTPDFKIHVKIELGLTFDLNILIPDTIYLFLNRA